VLDEEFCCGAPLLDLGDRAAFERRAGENIERLNAAGAERVLALCPHCTAALTNDYFDVGELEVEVVSLPRYLAELQAEGRLKTNAEDSSKESPEEDSGVSSRDSLKVTFHDPCRLSRFLEEGEEPRALLDSLAGVERLEMGRSGKSAWCCGSGAWAAQIVPDLSRFAARERVAEARATGAACIVTACSYCTDSLRKAAGRKTRVVHLAELIAERMKAGNPKRT
jgi:Fe-S oxidoreductase